MDAGSLVIAWTDQLETIDGEGVYAWCSGRSGDELEQTWEVLKQVAWRIGNVVLGHVSNDGKGETDA